MNRWSWWGGLPVPGRGRDPACVWEVVAAGRDLVSEFLADRGWDVGELFDPIQMRWARPTRGRAKFVADVAGFDAGFFGIASGEALAMDRGNDC